MWMKIGLVAASVIGTAAAGAIYGTQIRDAMGRWFGGLRGGGERPAVGRQHGRPKPWQYHRTDDCDRTPVEEERENWPRRTRTSTSRSRVCCATITPGANGRLRRYTLPRRLSRRPQGFMRSSAKKRLSAASGLGPARPRRRLSLSGLLPRAASFFFRNPDG